MLLKITFIKNIINEYLLAINTFYINVLSFTYNI